MTYSDLSKKQRESYEDLDAASKLYPLEFTDDGVLRFQQKAPVRYLIDRVNLNDLWTAAHRGSWPMADMMELYRNMGYSLCGYMEIFGERMDRETC